MIFKAVKGVTVPLVGDLWNSSSSQSENTMAALDTTTTHHAHYKNRIVQEWETFNPAQVINWKETDCLKRQQQQQQKHDQYKNKQTNKQTKNFYTNLKCATFLPVPSRIQRPQLCQFKLLGRL